MLKPAVHSSSNTHAGVSTGGFRLAMVRVSASLKQANITYQAFFLSFFFSGESVVKLLPTLLWKDQKFSLLTTLILSHSFSCFPHAI